MFILILGNRALAADAEAADDFLRLAEHEPGFASYGYELESGGDAFARAVRIEGVHTSGNAMLARCFQDVLHRVDERFVLAIKCRWLAHGIQQIIRANEDRIDAWHTQDFLGGFDALDVLDHDD